MGFEAHLAWLQSGNATPLQAMRLFTGEQVDEFTAQECRLGAQRLYGQHIWQEGAAFCVALIHDASLADDGFVLEGRTDGITILGGKPFGLLYGVYAFLMHLGAGTPPQHIHQQSAPAAARRVLNHWDNITGDIERGYAGKSIFFRDGQLAYDPDRMVAYARLLASIGINQLSINNVNVTAQSARLITPQYLPQLAALAQIFRPFGIQLILSVHFDSPVILDGLPHSDPLDAAVAAWWHEKAAQVYAHIPDLAGFLVKADSEFQAGPASFGRTQADGANTIARALAPHGGTLYWRCFVYDCMQDWRDTQTDRPMAAYQHFFPLDGSFDENVVLQIKNGPVDFQVREPLSPLLGTMSRTRQALEFQITQEYTGQQIDLFALAVQWEEVLSSYVNDQLPLRGLIGSKIDTVAAVANIGNDDNWTGHLLAQCNWFAFGRLAWDPTLSARQILTEWVHLTFGSQPSLVNPLVDMLLASRHIYESYTAPLGIGWMVNTGNHYGPSVDGYEYSAWGTYHRADHTAIGVDRTPRGTGFTTQYHPHVAAQYNSLEACPENLLLFFHRLPYNYRLKSGKTLLQTIYDMHFTGVAQVQWLMDTWQGLKKQLDPKAYDQVRERLERQLSNAKEWRDVVNTYFYRKTGIPDEQGRHIYG